MSDRPVYPEVPAAVIYLIFPGGAGGNFLSVLLSDMTILRNDSFKDAKVTDKFHYDDLDRNEWRAIQPRLFKPIHPDIFFLTERNDGGKPVIVPSRGRYREILEWSKSKRIVYVHPGRAMFPVKALNLFKQGGKYAGKEKAIALPPGLINHRRRWITKEQQHNLTFCSSLRQSGADVYEIDYADFFDSPDRQQLERLQAWLYGKPLTRDRLSEVDESKLDYWIKQIRRYNQANCEILARLDPEILSEYPEIGKYIYGNVDRGKDS